MPKLGEVASPLVLRQESAWIGLQATNCSDVGGTQQAIYSFDLDAGGSVTGAGVLSDFSPGRGPDGMAIDQDGNIYAARMDQPQGIYVYSQEGPRHSSIQLHTDVYRSVEQT